MAPRLSDRMATLETEVGEVKAGVQKIHEVLHLNGKTPYVTELIEQAPVIIEQTRVIARLLPTLEIVAQGMQDDEEERRVLTRRLKRRKAFAKKYFGWMLAFSTAATIVGASLVNQYVSSNFTFVGWVPHPAAHASASPTPAPGPKPHTP